jgi:ribosome-associated protein
VASGEYLEVTEELAIPAGELCWRFSASGGPGGQHVNTSNTRVELRFEVESSPTLSAWQRARLLERIGPVVRVVASDERSQLRNRELALERLSSQIARALAQPRSRRPTAPSRASRERRLAGKRERSALKSERSFGRGGDVKGERP